MNRLNHSLLLVPLFLCNVCGFAAPEKKPETIKDAPPTVANRRDRGSQSYTITERGANHRVWAKASWETNEVGRVKAITNSYTELATGMHFKNERGEWVESKEEIEILPNDAGAIARKGQHKAIFPPEIKSGLIELQMPDGQWMRSRVWGLAYFDNATGESVLLAEVKESDGKILGDNVVIYPDAFTDFEADIRYTYMRAGFEQDVVLRESPPTPQELGLNPETTRMQVLTEFVEAKQPKKNYRQAGKFADETLGFGAMSIGAGKAFAVDGAGKAEKHVPVAKQWGQLEGRDFLVEEVPYSKVVEQLHKLPAARKYNGASLLRRGNGESVLAGLKQLVPKRYVKATPDNKQPAGKPQRMAKAKLEAAPSFVMDYVALTSQTNFTFRGDTTYYINGGVNLSGTTTFEGGSVVKFDSSSSATISINDPAVIWKTAPYLPAIFTAKDDNSIGQIISGSSGSPSGYYGGGLSYGGYYTSANPAINCVRFSYLRAAVTLGFDDAQMFSLANAQFVNCSEAVFYTGSLTVENTLFHKIETLISTPEGETSWHGTHLTINECGIFNNAWKSDLSLINCLLVAVTNINGPDVYLTTWHTNSNVQIGSPAGIFQTVGAGAHYLATDSPYRNAGTTNIDAMLLADLRKKTTYPPVILTNTISTNTTLSPQAQRDTDVTDLGYHYDPIDYWAACQVTNATVTLTNGVIVGYYREYGFWMHNDSRLVSTGSPTVRNQFIHYGLVQEQPVLLSPYSLSSSLAINPYHTEVASAPDVLLDFTSFKTVQGANYLMYAGYVDWNLNRLEVRNCEFYGPNACMVYETYGGMTNITCRLINNLIDAAYSLFVTEGGYGATCELRNNLFLRGIVDVYDWTAPIWVVKDNAFNGQSAYIDGNISHNAYLNGTVAFAPVQTNDIVVSNLLWVAGPLGQYYQPTNSPLINADASAKPVSVELFYHTTTTNEVAEGASHLDIGYHYVALDGYGNPADSNSDGIADYVYLDSDSDSLSDDWELTWFGDLSQTALSDYDGDGLSNAQEWTNGTDPTNPDTDFDGLSDSQEISSSTNPLVANPPLIATHPQSQTVIAGTNATLSITPTGNVLANYHFQWWRNSQLLTGATNQTLTLSSVNLTNEGIYSVVISNSAGAVRSLFTRLTVWSPGFVVAWGTNNLGQTNVPAGLSNVVSVSAGHSHCLALKIDGTLAAWGNDAHGELNIPAGLTNVAVISAGRWQNLVLKEDGTMVAWGFNTSGQGSVPPGLSNIVAIASCGYFNLALRSNGKIVAWGDNSAGGTGQTNVPTSLSNVVAMAGGFYNCLALKVDGTVVGWGNNPVGELTIPAGLTNAIDVVAGHSIAGYTHSGALRSDGSVIVWASNYYGQTNVPALATNVVRLRSGYDHLLAVRADGSVIAWGRNDAGQTTVPAGLTGVGTVSGGYAHSIAALPYDFDVDALPDNWERQYFGDLTHTGNADSDSDGLTDLQEYLCGSNPTNPDSDGDGLPDGWEWNYFGNFAQNAAGDPDGDGVSNLLEFSNLTNPINPDTDFDGLSDGQELSAETGPKIANAPVILSNPKSQITLVGGAVTFSVNMTGCVSTNYHYQWQCNGVNLVSGGNSGTLSLTNVQLNNAGVYNVVVSNSFGATRSSYAALRVWKPGMLIAWNNSAQITPPVGSNDIVAVAAGEQYSLILRQDGAVSGFPSDNIVANVPTGTTNAIAVAAGYLHGMALTTNGNVLTWGDNSQGQTNNPSGLAEVISIAAGAYHSVALKNNGSVIVWGGNTWGQTNVPAGLSNVIAVSASGDFTLALKDNGSVIAWGKSDAGQTLVPGELTGVIGIAAGQFHALALKSDRTVVAWGTNDHGQCDVPAGVSNVFSLFGGGYHSLALKQDGSLVAWGGIGWENGSTGLGGPNTITASAGSYHDVAIIAGPVINRQPSDQSVGYGSAVTFSVVASGPLPLTYQWYRDGVSLTNDLHISGADTPNLSLSEATIPDQGNYTVVVGDGAAAPPAVSAPAALTVVDPITMQPQSQFTHVGDTVVFTVASTPTPTSHQWRRNDVPISNGTLADGTIVSGATTATLTLRNVQPGRAGAYSVVINSVAGTVTSLPASLMVCAPPSQTKRLSGGLAIQCDGTVWTCTSPPAQIQGLSDVIAVAGGFLALSCDGTVWAWGNNDYGQLGDGTIVSRSNPLPVHNLSGVTAIAAGWGYGLALKADGSIWAWGKNSDGQLGDGTQTSRLTPVRSLLPVGTSIVSISAGPRHAFAISITGTVWGWGSNDFAQLGNGGGDDQLTPIQIPSFSGAQEIACVIYTTLVRKGDNSVWAVGGNHGGALGNGSAVQYSSVLVPVQNLASGVISLAASTDAIPRFWALKSNGSVLGWGYNVDGGLGDGTSVSKNTPTSLSVLPFTLGISAGTALAQDFTLRVWGGSFGVTPVSLAGYALCGTLQITTQPASQSACEGATVQFSVSASVGTGPVTYEWRKNGSLLSNGNHVSGATSSTLTLSGVTAADADDNYTVSISNGGNSVSSIPATLAVSIPVTITTQPLNQTTTVNGNVSFTVAASGTGPFTYQWKFNGNNISNGGNVSGATSQTLTLNSILPSQVGLYTVTVTGACGPVTSLPASLALSGPPVFVTAPVNHTVFEGYNLIFTANAVGSGPLAYQWKFNEVDIPGATGQMLTINNAQLNQAGVYKVVVTGPFGSINASASLTVKAIAFPTSARIAAGYNHSVTLRSDGTVWAWGDNSYGQMGDATWITRPMPVQVLGLSDVIKVTASGNSSLALKKDGTLWIVGGQSRNYSPNPMELPRSMQVLGLSGVIDIAGAVGQPGYPWPNTTDNYTILKSDGTVWSLDDATQLNWPIVLNNQLTFIPRPPVPVRVNGPSGVIAVYGGGQSYRHMIQTSDGNLWQWGYGYTPNSTPIPIQMNGLSGVIDVVSGLDHVLALTSSGNIWAWGSDLHGQLGDGSMYQSWQTDPILIPNISGAVAIGAGAYHSLAVKSDGSVWAWGQNNSGQLGSYNTGWDEINNPYWSLEDQYAPKRVEAGGVHSPLQGAAPAIAGGPNFGVCFMQNCTLRGWGSSIPAGTADLDPFLPWAEPVLIINPNTGYVPYTVCSSFQIVSQPPANQTICPDSTMRLTVTAAGSGLTYQWKKGGSDLSDGIRISGTKSANLIITGILADDQGTYTVRVSDSSGAYVDSATITITVAGTCTLPTIITPPQNITVGAGLPATATPTFTVTASGPGPLTYQWRKNEANLIDAGNISGAKTATLTIWPISQADADVYTVLVSNQAGPVPSSAATLTFSPDPDGDGWCNAKETATGTDPNDPDTDADGVLDSIDLFPLDGTKSQADPPHNQSDTTPPVIQLIHPVNAI